MYTPLGAASECLHLSQSYIGLENAHAPGHLAITQASSSMYNCLAWEPSALQPTTKMVIAVDPRGSS